MPDYVYEEERRALPWYDSYATPRAESSEKYCRSPRCPDTNWAGTDRLHSRGITCPPLEDAADHPHERVENSAQYLFERQAADQKETAAPSKNNEQIDLLLESIDNLADQIYHLADIMQNIDLTLSED